MSSKRRTKKIPGVAGVQLGLIITPMLDMSFQLLAFFIMIYSPNALEGHLAGKLASPMNTAVKSNVPVDPLEALISDPDPDTAETLTVRVDAVPPAPKNATADELVLRQEKYGSWRDGEPYLVKIASKVDILGQIVWDERRVPERDLERPDRPLLPSNFKLLTDRLKLEVDKGAKKANIRIDNPDGHLKHLSTIYVYDACKLAGFQNISLVPPQRETAPDIR
jgi:biopolymer transport protein ExbD